MTDLAGERGVDAALDARVTAGAAPHETTRPALRSGHVLSNRMPAAGSAGRGSRGPSHD